MEHSVNLAKVLVKMAKYKLAFEYWLAIMADIYQH